LLLQREKQIKEREIITMTGSKQMDRRLSAPPASWEADRATTKQLDNSIQVSGAGEEEEEEDEVVAVVAEEDCRSCWKMSTKPCLNPKP
jgi:hypothetical protein